jgi:uncharacterized protein (DUF4415 family)
MKRRTRVTKGRTIAKLHASASSGKRSQEWTAEMAGMYRPLKKPVTLRLDADVLAWFKKLGPGYQTRINRALRGLMIEDRKKSGG